MHRPPYPSRRGERLCAGRAGGSKIDGKQDLPLKAGQPLQFAPGEMHNVCNTGSAPFKALAHYIVEKGKPLVTRAQD